MTVKVLNSKIYYQKNTNEIVLTEQDFDPCNPFFLRNKIVPESVSIIKTKGVLEVSRYIRETLKVLDYLCKVGGEIQIEFFRDSLDTGGGYVRPLNYLLNELSLCYKERYILFKSEFKNGIDYLYFKKIRKTLPGYDDITKWTFGIVSNGKKNDRVLSIIEQIYKFKIPQFEILICGPAPSTKIHKHVKILDDKELYFDTRIPISKKKNTIIENANYNNLVIIHDRISFSSNWYEIMLKHGNYYNQLCFPVLDEDSQSLRVNDWLSFNYDKTNFRRSRSRVLNYGEWDENIYVDGGIMIIKKHVVKNVKFNPLLNWNEMEDVDLSKRLYLDGSIINFCSNTFFLTETHRHNVQKPSFIWKVLFRLFGRFFVYVKNTIVKRRFDNFLSSSN
jgi:hypothetical protein